jgi:heterodisulfide reductase subunit B2
MKYLYYPGCSLKSSGISYEESLLSVFKKLNIQLEELDDWNCCGATNYMSICESDGYSLTARNLAIAEKQSKGGNAEVVAPCAACYMGLLKTNKYISTEHEIKDEVNASLKKIGMVYNGNVNVRHPLDVICKDLGLDALKKAVEKPLKGLKVASYYGCQLVRPMADFDDQHDPQTMDNIVKALGGEPVDWPLKTKCCSGSMTSTIGEIGLRMNFLLLKEAKDRGADVIITACPLCQFNLECFQDKISRKFEEDVKLPVYYFTQLMGMALNLSKQEVGLHRQISPMVNVSQ